MALNRTDVLADAREDFYQSRIRTSGPLYAGFDLPTAETVIGLLLTYDLIHQCQSRYMADFGLSKSTFHILVALKHGPPEGMLLHDLGEMLLVSRANITGLMDHLEEKAYVIRVVDQADRRARFARITPKAAALLDDFMPLHFENSAVLLASLSGDDKRDLIRLLKKARQSIRAHADVCERQPAANRGQ